MSTPSAAQVARERAVRRVVEEQAWIEECGGSLSGYIERYGHSTDPEHYGDGAEAIYAADVAALRNAEDNAEAVIRAARS